MREANDIFAKYQEQSASGTIQLRRWPLRAVRLRSNLCFDHTDIERSINVVSPHCFVDTPLITSSENASLDELLFPKL